MATPEPHTSLLPMRFQPLLACGTGLGLLAAAAWWVSAGGFTGGLVAYDDPPVLPAPFAVDVNAADDVELAQLPGLGPAMARRVVDHRRDHGPFTAIESLLDVPGIGAATLERMRPHLRPIEPAAGGSPQTAAPAVPDAPSQADR